MEDIKRCKCCLVYKPIAEFNRVGWYTTQDGVRHPRLVGGCKSCMSIICKARIDRIILSVIGEWKCSRCGYNKCRRAIEFHHIDPTEKELIISEMWTYAETRIVAELNKCIAVCSNCHREIHDGHLV